MRLFRRPSISKDAQAPSMTITPVEGLALARRGQDVIATCTNVLSLAEGTYPDVLYFPVDHVNPEALKPVSVTTECPWKGTAAYFDLPGAPQAVWTYHDAKEEVADIAGRLAFNAAYVDFEILSLPALPEAAEQILIFWFEKTSPKLHFVQNDAFDQSIRERFGSLYLQGIAGELDDWQGTPRGTLALLILLDQFSRNLFRKGPEAYAQDERAQVIASEMVARGWDLALDPTERAFAYLPFMHAEDMDLQNWSVDLYNTRLPGSSNVPFALGHRETFHRHGRFPGRDSALGR